MREYEQVKGWLLGTIKDNMHKDEYLDDLERIYILIENDDTCDKEDINILNDMLEKVAIDWTYKSIVPALHGKGNLVNRLGNISIVSDAKHYFCGKG